MSSKILLTGHKGFIGQNIRQALWERGEGMLLMDKGDGLQGIADCDVVIHQAAITDTLEHDVNKMMLCNFQLSKDIFDVAFRFEKRVIYASSAAAYGSEETGTPLNIYGWSKYCAEQHGLQLFQERRNSFVALRYFNVYGPHEDHKGNMASVARQMKLFPKKPRRDFVYVRDVVFANLHFMDNQIQNGVYEVGSGVARLFEDVCDILEVPYIYRDEKDIPEGYQFYTCSNRDKWMPGWEPQYTLETGLLDYKTVLGE